MKPISLSWLKDLSPDRKEGFETLLRNNTVIFNRLREILLDWEGQIAAEGSTKEQYNSPAWSHLQAHRNGNREIIRKMKELINFY